MTLALFLRRRTRQLQKLVRGAGLILSLRYRVGLGCSELSKCESGHLEVCAITPGTPARARDPGLDSHGGGGSDGRTLQGSISSGSARCCRGGLRLPSGECPSGLSACAECDCIRELAGCPRLCTLSPIQQGPAGRVVSVASTVAAPSMGVCEPSIALRSSIDLWRRWSRPREVRCQAGRPRGLPIVGMSVARLPRCTSGAARPPVTPAFGRPMRGAGVAPLLPASLTRPVACLARAPLRALCCALALGSHFSVQRRLSVSRRCAQTR